MRNVRILACAAALAGCGTDDDGKGGAPGTSPSTTDTADQTTTDTTTSDTDIDTTDSPTDPGSPADQLGELLTGGEPSEEVLAITERLEAELSFDAIAYLRGLEWWTMTAEEVRHDQTLVAALAVVGQYREETGSGARRRSKKADASCEEADSCMDSSLRDLEGYLVDKYQWAYRSCNNPPPGIGSNPVSCASAVTSALYDEYYGCWNARTFGWDWFSAGSAGGPGLVDGWADTCGGGVGYPGVRIIPPPPTGCTAGGGSIAGLVPQEGTWTSTCAGFGQPLAMKLTVCSSDPSSFGLLLEPFDPYYFELYPWYALPDDGVHDCPTASDGSFSCDMWQDGYVTPGDFWEGRFDTSTTASFSYNTWYGDSYACEAEFTP